MSEAKRAKRERKHDDEKVYLYMGGLANDIPHDVTKLIFDSSVVEIPESAFQSLKLLRDIVFNEGLQKIEHGAFCDCTSLKRIVNFPSTLTEVGTAAFCGCKNLMEVLLNEGLLKILAGAFVACTSLKSIKLPSTVKEVEHGAFMNCCHLKEVVLNEGLTGISEDTFSCCFRLERITLPSTLTKIGDHAFDGCEQLTEVVINEKLQKIGRGVFHGCSSLECIKFPAALNRGRILFEADRIELERKLALIEGFEWRGDEAFARRNAISTSLNLSMTRMIMGLVIASIKYYEVREATTMFELALWKTRIEESGATTSAERNCCRMDVPGPVKDAILQYIEENHW